MDAVEALDQGWREADVTVNGEHLSPPQVMTLRVALNSFAMEMEPKGALGNDDRGESIRKGYLARAREILPIISRPATPIES